MSTVACQDSQNVDHECPWHANDMSRLGKCGPWHAKPRKMSTIGMSNVDHGNANDMPSLGKMSTMACP
ncbi:hypothetical protein DVH24_018544 [Malus domestica]|uniref:Uncharacterized protein n=1 Tax=Malus domestica TaxID=3750 RepID=A0A498KUL3_MALDO|nr:hypothetical protein DVH24_018544 [Malus domestica]